MITARLGGHEALEFDDELMRSITTAGVLNNAPKGEPFCRIGLLGLDGAPYRIVIAYSEDECVRIKQVLTDFELSDAGLVESGFDCVYSAAKTDASSCSASVGTAASSAATCSGDSAPRSA